MEDARLFFGGRAVLPSEESRLLGREDYGEYGARRACHPRPPAARLARRAALGKRPACSPRPLHPASPPRNRARLMTAQLAAEFFAGIGLVRMALERAGWTVRLAND